MNLMANRAISIFLITLVTMGVLFVPGITKAAWTDIFGTISNSYRDQDFGGGPDYYDYNSTDSDSNGDIEMTKEVKEIGEDDSYHDKIEVRSGALVEVWIEIRNTSGDKAASTIMRDELGGSMVYVKNSLRVNGQTSQPGLTSGGLRINIPAKGKATIIYRMNVCGSSSYPMRAYASAPGIGAATDAIIIVTENFSVGYYDDTSTCISQFTNTGTTTGTYSTPASNPFAGWTGVNNLTSTNANNPFAGWTGVDNSHVINSYNPFGDWYGVQNDPTSNPFGTWTGVQNNPASNPFGDWTGVDSDGYDARGYSTASYATANDTSYPNYVNSTTAINGGSRPTAYTQRVDTNYAQATPTYFVAPKTGVDEYAPFMFAGLLSLGFMAYRNRKSIFK